VRRSRSRSRSRLTAKLVPATAPELPPLAELFSACFADYAVPMPMDAGALREHVETNGIDLECSRVVVEERPAAFALIARRAEPGCVGGIGTMPSHRRRALGAQALVAGIEAARDRGCRSMWLKVIDSNRAACRCTVNVPQIAAADEASAADALLAATGGRQDLRLAKVPADEASPRALRSLGAKAIVTLRTGLPLLRWSSLRRVATQSVLAVSASRRGDSSATLPGRQPLAAGQGGRPR